MEGLLRLLGMQLRAARKHAGMSRREVSIICGEAKEKIKNIERGDWEPKGWHELNAIANIGIAIQIRLDEKAKGDAVRVREEAEDKGDFNYHVTIAETLPAPAPEVSFASCMGEYIIRNREREGKTIHQLSEASGIPLEHVMNLEASAEWEFSTGKLASIRQIGAVFFLWKAHRMKQDADAKLFKEAFGE